MRILAVDDELQVLRYLQHALEGAGYQALVTGDSSQVVKLVEMEEPDLVLLDLRLPGLSGFDLLQRIREFSAVPVIFLTASDSDEDTVATMSRSRSRRRSSSPELRPRSAARQSRKRWRHAGPSC
jgi:two-component system KDP operon response regulator KdpE